jgi:hypothetical protein
MTTNTDHQPGEVKNQGQQYADEARARIGARRRQHDEGLAGWLKCKTTFSTEWTRWRNRARPLFGQLRGPRRDGL